MPNTNILLENDNHLQPLLGWYLNQYDPSILAAIRENQNIDPSIKVLLASQGLSDAQIESLSNAEIRQHVRTYMRSEGNDDSIIDDVLEAHVGKKSSYDIDYIKTPDGKIAAIRYDVVCKDAGASFNLVQGYWRALSQSLLRDEPPPESIKVISFINHDSAHWTTSVAEFQLDRAFYSELKEKFLELYPDEAQRQKLKTFEIQNFINDFIHVTHPELDIVHGYQLVGTTGVHIDHYDSHHPGSKSSTWYKSYESSLALAVVANREAGINVTISTPKPKQQTGNTCGDYTLYNGFMAGIMGIDVTDPKYQIEPTALRAHSEHQLPKLVANEADTDLARQAKDQITTHIRESAQKANTKEVSKKREASHFVVSEAERDSKKKKRTRVARRAARPHRASQVLSKLDALAEQGFEKEMSSESIDLKVKQKRDATASLPEKREPASASEDKVTKPTIMASPDVAAEELTEFSRPETIESSDYISIELNRIEEHALLQSLKDLRTAQTITVDGQQKQIVPEKLYMNFGDGVNDETFAKMLEILNRNGYLNDISFVGKLKPSQAKKLKDIQYRNKLLHYYGVDKSIEENLWQELMEVHFRDFRSSGRYDVIKNYRDPSYLSAATNLGATFHTHFLAYLKEHQSQFESFGFPYNRFSPTLRSDDPYDMFEQVQTWNTAFQDPAFKCFFEEIEFNSIGHENTLEYWQIFNHELVSFLKASKGHDLKLVTLTPIFDDKVPFNEAAKELLIELLTVADEENLTTHLAFSRLVKLNDENTALLKKLENKIQKNIRAQNKALREGHFDATSVPAVKVKSDKPLEPSQIRACKRNPSAALAGVESEIQMQQQQQQQQQQQEQQQMQLQNQREAQLDALMQRKSKKGEIQAVDANKFMDFQRFVATFGESMAFHGNSYSNKPAYQSCEQLWHNLVGDNGIFATTTEFSNSSESIPPHITGISKTVADLLVNYPQLFIQGLNLDDLPPGFVLKHDKENEKHLLLDYDAALVKLLAVDPDKKSDLHTHVLPTLRYGRPTWAGDASQFSEFPENPLTENDLDEVKGIGNEDVFKKGTPEEKTELLLKFFKNEDRELGELVESNYKDLLGLFDTEFALIGISNVVYFEGVAGAKVLLDKLETMRITHGEQATKDFIKLFLANNCFSAANMLQTEQLNAVDQLNQLTPGEFNWWIKLNKDERKYNSDIHFLDQLNAFMEFKQKLTKLDPNLKMGKPCPSFMTIDSSNEGWEAPVEEIKNMRVALSRILTILNNAIDIEEQFYHLDGLSLGHYDAYHASEEHGYYLVTPEMELTLRRLDKTISSHGIAKALYEISIEDFPRLCQSDLDIASIKPQFFRLLGRQPYIDRYQNYLNVMERFDFYRKQFQEQQKSESSTKLGLALLALATHHKLALGAIKPDMVDQMFHALEQFESMNPQNRNFINQALYSYFENTSTAVPIGSELEALITFHIELGFEHQWNQDPKNIVVSTSNYYSILAQRYRAAEKFKTSDTPAISSIQLVHAFEAVAKSELLNKDQNTALREKVLALFAKMSSSDMSEQNMLQLLARVEQAHTEDQNKLVSILDVLSDLDPQHENTTALPSVLHYKALFDKLMADSSINSPTSIFKAITKANGFEHCHYDNNSLPEFDADAAKRLIAENKDEIKQQLEAIGMQVTDEELEDPKALLERIKSVADKIPLLSVVLGKFKDASLTEHHQAMSAYAKTKLISGTNDEPVYKKLSAIIQNNLYDKDVSKSSTVEELLITMQNIEQRNSNVKNLIDTLARIKTRSNQDYQEVVTVLQSGHGVSEIPVEHLFKIIETLNRTHKTKFPTEALMYIVNNNQVKEGKIKDWDKTVDRHLHELIRKDNLPTATLAQLLDASLTLIGKNKLDELDSLKQIVNTYSEHSAAILDFIQTAYSDSQYKANELIKNHKLIACINNILTDIDAQSDFNPNEVKNMLIGDLTKHPSVLLEILPKLESQGNDESKKRIAAHLTIINRLLNKEGKSININLLFEKLNTKDLDFVIKLANIDDEVGFPSVEAIIEIIDQNQSIEALIESSLQEKRAKREAELSVQFSDNEVHRVLEGMQDLSRDGRLYYQHRSSLQEDFYFINAIGHSHGITVDPCQPDSASKPIKDFSKQEIKGLLAYYKHIYQNPSSNAHQKREAQLIYLALLRESMYRATGRVPYSTQIIAVLNAMQRGQLNLAEITTGQGKSLISAMYGAMLGMDGQAVDICTSNLQLARDGLKENAGFFEYIGVPAKVIDSTSPLDDYLLSGINYSDVSQLALFRARSKIEGGKEPEKASLVLDEADYTLLDDTTQYRYAVSLDEVGDPTYNPYAWIYDLVNEFIETNEFSDKKASIQDDIDNLRRFLIERAKSAQVDFVKDKDLLPDKQLDVWIDSAVAAQALFKLEGKKWTLREEEQFGKQVAVARLIGENKRVSPDAQYSNGVQQFLHARINQNHPRVIAGDIPKCNIDPEKQAVASLTSKNFIDYYRGKGGNVWGITGTIGSEDEKIEHYEKFGFELSSLPSHQMQNRVDRAPIMVDTDVQHQELIFQQVLKRIRSNDKMPTLVICKDAPTSKALAEYIEAELAKQGKHYPLTLQLYNGIDKKRVDYTATGSLTSDLSNEEKATEQAGLQGTITISTPMMGRGTDFKPLAKDKKKKGQGEVWTKHPNGLFVVQTYVDSERTSRQIIGRSGRQGWHGESMTIISQESLVRDFALVGEPGREIDIQAPSTSIEALQDIQTLNDRDRRRFSEAYGDLRNQFFGSIIKLLDTIPSYCEEQEALYKEELQKDESERDLEQFDRRDASVIRKEVLKAWESYLNDMDVKWKKILADQQSPDLETALDQMVSIAVTRWNQDFRGFDGITNIHCDSTDIESNIQKARALREKRLAQREKQLPDTYKALPKSVNVERVICDRASDPTSAQIETAYRNEMQNALDKLKDISKYNRKIKFKAPKDWQNLSTTQQYQFIISTIRGMSDGAEKHSSFQSLVQTRQLEQHVQVLPLWIAQFPSGKETAEQCKTIQFSSDLAIRKRICKTAPHRLMQHDRDMLSRESRGLYPNKAFSNYMGANDAVRLLRVKEDCVADMKDYLSLWFRSRTKKSQANLLNNQIKQSHSLESLMKSVVEARIHVILLEKNTDLTGKFFDKTDQIIDRVIHNANKDIITQIQKLQLNDIQTVLKEIGSQTTNEMLKQQIKIFINANYESDNITKAYQHLEIITSNIPNDSKYKPMLQKKCAQLKALQQRIELIAQLSPAAVPQSTIVSRSDTSMTAPTKDNIPMHTISSSLSTRSDATNTASVTPPSPSDVDKPDQAPKRITKRAKFTFSFNEISKMLDQKVTSKTTISSPEEMRQHAIDICKGKLNEALADFEKGEVPEICHNDVPSMKAKEAITRVLDALTKLEENPQFTASEVRAIPQQVKADLFLRYRNPITELAKQLEDLNLTNKQSIQAARGKGGPASAA